MKVRYEVSAYGGQGNEVVKTFKGERNEVNAIAFLEDMKNVRAFGPMTLTKQDQDGKRFEWLEDSGWTAI